MKKLALLALCLLIFSGCKKEPQSTPDPVFQDYTSFVFEQTIDNLLPNCVAGYFDADGYCWKIADLGDISKGNSSSEITLPSEDIPSIYLFSDYYGVRMLNKEFTLIKRTKNIFNLTADIGGIEVDKNNPKQYPQIKSQE